MSSRKALDASLPGFAIAMCVVAIDAGTDMSFAREAEARHRVVRAAK